MKKHVLAVIGLVLFLLYLLAALGTARGSPDLFFVNSTADPGVGTCDATECTLREAIDAANAIPGSYIEFNIPITDTGYMVSGITGTWTISLTASLPTLSGGGTVISGTTQAAFIGDDPNPDGPEIEIAGAAMASGDCLTITSANNVIHGLVINRCFLRGILISSSSATTNTISGNYIGTDASGALDLGNYDGVRIENGAQNNVIGGDTPGERNVISGNTWFGVEMGSGTNGNTVSGNYIGTDASGALGLGNYHGVYINGTQNNVIGGDTPGDDNVISGNDWSGVHIFGGGTNGNTVSGNYIGTDATGSSDLGNGEFGVYISGGAQNNTIGGDTEGERNILSGNDWYGVFIDGNGTDGNTVSGNHIGIDTSGSFALGNTYGVVIRWGAQNNTIGGDAPGESNVIAFNVGDGVDVNGATTTGNTITQNSIHSNTLLGIDNWNGGNIELPPPAISGASCAGISGTAPADSTVEVFTGPDEEGKTYLTTVSADGGGNWGAPGPFTLDTYVTATATDASGNTSEFSTQVTPGTCYQISLPLIMKNY